MELAPLICPCCGANLKNIGEAVAVLCRFCRQTLEIADDRVMALEQRSVACDGTPDIRLPIWRLRFTTTVKSMAALPIGQATGEGSPSSSTAIHSIPELFWATAFPVTNFINYTADLSLAISMRAGEVFLEPVAEPVSLELCRYHHRDGQRMAAVLLDRMVSMASPGILDPDIEIAWQDHLLAWWPFARSGDCWIDLVHGQRILASALGRAADDGREYLG